MVAASGRSDGTHSVFIPGDVEHLACPVETNCAWDGTYTQTISTITTVEPNHPDPGERGEDTSSYVVCGGRLFTLDETRAVPPGHRTGSVSAFPTCGNGTRNLRA